ncbi:MAG: polysaccharide biosynthesis/export family protein [Pyrinomonadaceae bacterium]
MQLSNSKLFGFLTVILLLFFLLPESRSQTAEKTENFKTVSTVEDAENLIHIGDLINVDVVGSTEYDWRGGLTPEGYLNGLNFVDEPIYGLCRTQEQVATDVAKGYEKFLRNPQVVVKIIDRSRRPVSFLYGAVGTPQRFQLRRAVKLNELLILAGGITEQASGEIQILRSQTLSCSAKKSSPNKQTSDSGNLAKKSSAAAQSNDSEYINIEIGDLLKGKPESNPQILTGDVVTVLESKPIYVTGGVVNPKQINARSEINVSRAIAEAGGLAKNADPKKVTVFRVENRETKAIEIDLDKVKAGQTADMTLQAFDIIDVAQKGKERSKYAPVINAAETDTKKSQNLPLRIID